MEKILNYRNIKTNSYINFISTNIDDIDDFCYLCKMINYQDEKVMKNNRIKLATVLNNLKNKKVGE